MSTIWKFTAQTKIDDPKDLDNEWLPKWPLFLTKMTAVLPNRPLNWIPKWPLLLLTVIILLPKWPLNDQIRYFMNLFLKLPPKRSLFQQFGKHANLPTTAVFKSLIFETRFKPKVTKSSCLAILSALALTFSSVFVSEFFVWASFNAAFSCSRRFTRSVFDRIAKNEYNGLKNYKGLKIWAKSYRHQLW